jgi:general stress protein 26
MRTTDEDTYMLTKDMQTLIRNHTAGMVATIDAAGRPSVSPKATFVVVDDRTIGYGNIRSPGTSANIERNPAVEVCFIDVVTRKAVRVTGSAQLRDVADLPPAARQAFEAVWADYLPIFAGVVIIDVSAAEMILSPAYDRGQTEAELRAANLQKLNNL